MEESDTERAVRIARSILDGTTPVFLGCKQLVGPLNRLGIHHREPFVTITGVDSETDDVPVWPGEREMWNKERLAEEDAKLAAWLPQIREHVFEACRAVVQRFGRITTMTPTAWPFDQPRNCAVLTLRSIVFEGAPILHVSHDADDHGWQFLGAADADFSDATVVSLEELVDRDPTLLELADLPPGWHAWRQSPSEPWQRAPRPADGA